VAEPLAYATRFSFTLTRRADRTGSVSRRGHEW